MNDKRISDIELIKFQIEEDRKNPERQQKELKILRDIMAKHNVGAFDIIIISAMLQDLGYARCKETANALRAVVDVIESEIETRETVEARFKGEFH